MVKPRPFKTVIESASGLRHEEAVTHVTNHPSDTTSQSLESGSSSDDTDSEIDTHEEWGYDVPSDSDVES